MSDLTVRTMSDFPCSARVRFERAGVRDKVNSMSNIRRQHIFRAPPGHIVRVSVLIVVDRTARWFTARVIPRGERVDLPTVQDVMMGYFPPIVPSALSAPRYSLAFSSLEQRLPSLAEVVAQSEHLDLSRCQLGEYRGPQ